MTPSATILCAWCGQPVDADLSTCPLCDLHRRWKPAPAAAPAAAAPPTAPWSGTASVVSLGGQTHYPEVTLSRYGTDKPVDTIVVSGTIYPTEAAARAKIPALTVMATQIAAIEQTTIEWAEGSL